METGTAATFLCATSDRSQGEEPEPAAWCAHEMFESQARRRPEAVALVDGNRSMSYAELNQCANALAVKIRAGRVQPEMVVALLAEGGLARVIGILGIHKAGAAYLPLDSREPEARLHFQIEDSVATCLVAEDGLASLATRPVIQIDLQARETENPRPAVPGIDHLAYAIYTSGSTGKPKGALLAHRGLATLIRFTGEQMQIGPGDRILQFASFTFDASIWEIYSALAHGATLVLSDRDSLQPGPELHELIRAQAVTVVLLSPSVLQVLPSHGLDRVRIVVAGTEKCTRAVVQRWARGRRFFNAYGPTETTIYSTIAEVDPDEDGDPSIGLPVPGTHCVVLDSAGVEAPREEFGELLIAGEGVARGYINRPDLTEEKFVLLSLDGVERRYYRTGDRVRLRPDGSLEYFGRIDRQLKIRGFRVEPAEIENCLDLHPDIASSAVVSRTAPDGNSSLVAFFVVAPGRETPTSQGLSAYLSQILPRYLVPTMFVKREEWRLTPNGKLDRQALLCDMAAPVPGSHAGPESLTPNGERLRALCQKVIGALPIKPSDSLLELGLNSLSAASIAWHICEELGVRIRPSEILQNPTLEGILSRVEVAGSGNPLLPAMWNDEPRPERIPLSFSQEQIWFLEELHPRLNSYRFQAVFACIGTLDVPALEASLNWVVSRHEILRTTFVADQGEIPRQKISPHAFFKLPYEDLRVLPAATRRSELERRVSEEVRRPFKHGDGLLIRWHLYQIGDEEFHLLHSEHHFLHDGWSYGVFLEELYDAYLVLVAGKKLARGWAPVQYADFALWQRKTMASGAWDDHSRYWRRELADCPPPPLLPADCRPGRQRTFEGLQIRRVIPEALWNQLGRACSRKRVTRFGWVLAAFQLFIHRCTGAADFCVGCGFANRRDPRTHGMLGMAINTLPIRAQFAGVRKFGDLLEHTSCALRSASDHQELPFAEIVREMNPPRDANNNPLFNAFIASYDKPYPDFQTDNLTISRRDGIACGHVKFDLVALLVPAERSAVEQTAPLLLWECSSDLFDSSTAEGMLEHFLTLLKSSVREPESHVASLFMMDGEERNRVLEFGRGPAAPQESETPLHRVFETVASAARDGCAIVVGEASLSYRELNIRSNRLARRLVGRGCSRGSIVAVALPRGSDAIVCFLAILKAGGAYLPIDLREPADRIAHLVGLVNARLVLTHSDLSSNLRRLPGGAEVLLVDEPFAAAEGNLSVDVSVDSAAYVLFTSGSSGVPKGVVVPHRAISRLVFGLPKIRFDRSQVVLHFAPLNFDASTFEIWGALLHGAKLVIHGDEIADMSALGETLGRHRVTTAWLTSSLFNQIIDSSPAILRGLRQLITGGEALSPEHIRKAQELLPGTRLFNGYGPTETTTFATVYLIPRPLPESMASVPIGRPLAGTQVLVLSSASGAEGANGRRELAPLGVPGELYIGGDGVALGYMDLPELTAERFVSDPLGLFSGRFYRTGDIVRWRSDGNLEFIGRADAQVKIRGYRIEPGEIESALQRHPGVGRAVVKVWEPAPGDKQLAAYYEAKDEDLPEARDLSTFLTGVLPRYMLPSAFIGVEKLPVTAAGKIDWRALPLPACGSQQAGAAGIVDARTALEAVLADIWAEVLKIDGVGVNEDFFLLGGHSLLALRLIHEVNGAFGVRLPVRVLFAEPTVAGLAREIDAHLDKKRLVAVYPALVPLRPGGRKKPFFLVAGGFGGEAELLVYAKLVRYLNREVPFYGLRARGVDELVEPHGSVEAMAAEHVASIRQVQPTGPYLIGGSCVGGVVAFEIAQQLRAAGEEIAQLIVIDCQFPSWGRYLRNRLRNFWRDQLQPAIDRCRKDPVELRRVINETLRLWFAPSEDESIGRRKIRIGQKYLRTIVRYSPRQYAGSIKLIVCQEQATRDPSRVWRQLAMGGLDVCLVPGDHLSHLREHVQETAAVLELALDTSNHPARASRDQSTRETASLVE